ncbi:ATPase [Sphingobacteriaceae bacterium]|nr:ATPase [Sphingobacteriaceae bacterium]
MKTIFKLNCVLISFLTLYACGEKGFNPNVTENSKVTFQVNGNCEMCKETIENSLKVEGVKDAFWDEDSKIITVSYDTTKISLDQMEKNVARVGYDNEKYKGDDKAYTDLPECCQYTRK